MNIFNSDKIDIEYDDNEMLFLITIYDNYGHYIDAVKVDRYDMKALYESLENSKDKF